MDVSSPASRDGPLSTFLTEKKRTLRRRIFHSCEALLSLARPSLPKRLPPPQIPRRFGRRISYPQLVSSPVDPSNPSWGIREERYDDEGDTRVERDEWGDERERESGGEWGRESGEGKWWRGSEEWTTREEPFSRWSTSFSTLEQEIDDLPPSSLPLYSPATSYLPPSTRSLASSIDLPPTPRLQPYRLPPIHLPHLPTPPPSPLLRRAPTSGILRLGQVRQEEEFTRRAMELLEEELEEDSTEEEEVGETILFEGEGEETGETTVEVEQGKKQERWESLVALTRRSV